MAPPGRLDAVTDHRPPHCQACLTVLPQAPGLPGVAGAPDFVAQQVTGLAVNHRRIIEYRLHRLACPSCGTRTDPGIPTHLVPCRIVRSPGAGDRRHAWWAVPPGPPENIRGCGAGVRGADQHPQRRRPLPCNRVSTRPSDRVAGRDTPLGTPAPCGRDALAPRWTHLVAVDGQECPGHGLCPHTQSRWPGDPGADLGGLPRRGHQRPPRRLQLAASGVADAGVLGTPRP